MSDLRIHPHELTQQHLGALVNGLGGDIDLVPWPRRNHLVRIVHEMERYRATGTFLGLGSRDDSLQAHGVFIPRSAGRAITLSEVTAEPSSERSAGGLSHDALGQSLRPEQDIERPEGGTWRLIRVEHELSYDGEPENTRLAYELITATPFDFRQDWSVWVPRATLMAEAGEQQ